MLLPYDGWANRHLLEECYILTKEKLERFMVPGHGNIDCTLAHLVGSMMFFADRLNQRPPRTHPGRDNPARTALELLSLFDAANYDLSEAIAKTINAHSLVDILNGRMKMRAMQIPWNQYHLQLLLRK